MRYVAKQTEHILQGHKNIDNKPILMKWVKHAAKINALISIESFVEESSEAGMLLSAPRHGQR